MERHSVESEKVKKTKGKVTRLPNRCQICSANALYSHFGVISCSSCQMFFKRNAEKNNQKKLQCRSNGHCEIDQNNRQFCRACRLSKCFSVGMQVELIRGQYSKRRSETLSSQITTLSLLQSDRSTLSSDQWRLLSNLIHCYDEYGQTNIAQNYLIHQLTLPLKKRFQLQSVQQFMFDLISSTRVFYEKNEDFLHLSTTNSICLIEKSIKQVCGLDAASIIFKSNLFNYSSFSESVDQLYDENTAKHSRDASYFLHQDPTFRKLVLGILMFSTIDCVGDQSLIELDTIRSILKIQDRYVELTWKYLRYRHGEVETIRSFSNLIRSLFSLIFAIDTASNVENYQKMIDRLIKQTEMMNVVNDKE